MTFPFKQIFIPGGAGFVGSNLALSFKRDFPNLEVKVLDNLKRRGSEINLKRLQESGVHFFHGDIRCPEDIDAVGAFDLLIDCSAEPSVHAGLTGSPLPVVHTNLTGTVNLMESARQKNAAIIFLSTSRVYPIDAINQLPFTEVENRFELAPTKVHGASVAGISEEFPLAGARSLYGTSKLASELLLQEYAFSYDLKVMVNRCGLLTGPWQMGKVDQGVIALFMARHFFGLPLKYIGYGGTGKQVRDMLHVDDLYDLLLIQAKNLELWNATPYNVGGGREVSLSLKELTALCQKVTGKQVAVERVPETSAVDIRIYLTDTARVEKEFSWVPKRSAEIIVEDIHDWLKTNKVLLELIFTGKTG